MADSLKFQNFYQVLDLSRFATPLQISEAYNSKLALITNAALEDSTRSARLRELEFACATLLDPVKRAQFDQQLSARDNRKPHYQTLDVEESAKPEDIKKAWRRLAKIHHFDVNPMDNEESRRFHSGVMIQINLAYEVLSDPIRKAEYDFGIIFRRDAGTPYNSKDESQRDEFLRDNLDFYSEAGLVAVPTVEECDKIEALLIESAFVTAPPSKHLVSFSMISKVLNRPLENKHELTIIENRDYIRAGLFVVGTRPWVIEGNFSFPPIAMLESFDDDFLPMSGSARLCQQYCFNYFGLVPIDAGLRQLAEMSLQYRNLIRQQVGGWSGDNWWRSDF